jgi:hypothetical protein
MKYLFYIILSTLIFLSCKKEEKYSEIPEIEYLRMTPSSTIEFQDRVYITISYQDGDGDIGTDDPDYYSLFVKDARLGNYDEYHILPLTPPDNVLQIEGELNIVLTGLFILDTNTSQSTSFSIKIRDRSGNWSNEVQTGSLTINKAI